MSASCVMAPVPADHPLRVAWDQWKNGEDAANSRKWAVKASEHIDGALWQAFADGFLACFSVFGGELTKDAVERWVADRGRALSPGQHLEPASEVRAFAAHLLKKASATLAPTG
jgi:hypothetical protein